MEIVDIPITEFYRKSLDLVYQKGFFWVVTLIARDADVKGLYKNLRKSWTSLDSITGEYFLFVFAGKEKTGSGNTVIVDSWEPFGESNQYVEFMNQDIRLCKSYLKDNFYANKDKNLKRLTESQTKAVNALRDYFSINESDIPCILFTKLGTHSHTNRVTHVVPITGNDIYGYFKDLFNVIEPLLKQYRETLIRTNELAILQKDLRIELKIKISKNPFKSEKKILELRKGLFIYAEKNIINDEGYSLLDCINNLSSGKFDEPLQSMLNLYINWVKKYEERTGRTFDVELAQRDVCQRADEIEQFKTKLSMIDCEKDELEKRHDDILCKIERAIGSSKMRENIKEKGTSSIIIQGNVSQIVYAADSEQVVVNQNIGCNNEKIMELIENIRKVPTTSISADDLKSINESLNVIEDELKKKEPRKGSLKTVVKSLEAIKGTVEFGAAVTALIQFIMSMP